MSDTFLKSPLNYTGGKYRLLPQILPLFPENINTFVDLFCGGGNVGINVKCNKVLFNDSAHGIIEMFKLWKSRKTKSLLKSIARLIRHFSLSESNVYGYGYYGCESSSGLSAYNRKPFENLKSELNKRKKRTSYSLYLFVAIVYAFNNQIRFNTKGNFNLPVGKRDFNDVEKNKFVRFVEQLHQIECEFSQTDFRNFDFSIIGENDFVYADPPYLITTASYNENGCWTVNEEKALLEKLDFLNNRSIKFALSNVLETKGMKNDILISWIESNPYLRCHHLNNSYSNSSYQRKNKETFTDEVLITNY